MTILDRLRPLADRVVVKRFPREEATPGGIIIPQTANSQDQAWYGEVLAVGPGNRLANGPRLEPSVKVGDKVLCGKYAGQEHVLEEEKFVVLREDDILAVFE